MDIAGRALDCIVERGIHETHHWAGILTDAPQRNVLCGRYVTYCTVVVPRQAIDGGQRCLMLR